MKQFIDAKYKPLYSYFLIISKIVLKFNECSLIIACIIETKNCLSFFIGHRRG